MTLLADRPPAAEMGAAYTTPTIVHFSAVLLLSALVRAPWHGIAAAAVAWGLTGVCGFIYELIVMRRMSAQSRYENACSRTGSSTWCCRCRPTRCSAVSAVAAFRYPHEAQFAVGAAKLTLLFAGIHNAWDAVTWHVMVTRVKDEDTQQSP